MKLSNPQFRFLSICTIALFLWTFAGCVALSEQGSPAAVPQEDAQASSSSLGEQDESVLPLNTSTPNPVEAPTDVSPPSTPDLALGLTLYKELYCGICHAFDAADAQGIFGPPHDNFSAIAQERILEAGYSGGAITVAEYVRESIVAPEVYLIDGFAGSRYVMPPYTHLSADELDALVAFLLQEREN